MPRLNLNVLGPLRITLADAPIPKFESDKARALLVYLAVESDCPHRREALTGLFWPELSEEAARNNLRQTLYNLRRALDDPAANPPFLLSSRAEIQFNPASDYALDLADFDACLAACAKHPHRKMETCAACVARLRSAVDLYRGKFLSEFFIKDSAEFEEWAVARREATHQRALEALTLLADYDEQHGAPDAACRYALRQLELDPWREQAHRQLMRVLARRGQPDAALAQYETCRRLLVRELGVEPSPETRALYERIKSGNWSASESDASARAVEASPLPTQLTPFVGRERELAELAELLGDPHCRWLTLVAPGGMGKTRLALQLAANQRHQFAHGAAFVSLAALRSTEPLAAAIADALGFAFSGPSSPRAQLANYLRDKELLLILDNVEQLVGSADWFAELLGRAPELKLLLTSREPLNVQGEWVFEVAGLEVPADEGAAQFEASSAVALFLQRARRTRAGFAPDADERTAVVRLCRLVEGMPLALELAATWVKTLSVSEIVAELEQNLDFLGAPFRDLPERHRSIRVVFDHSWQALTTQEQRALAELSVLRGDFQRAAAEQIAGASLSLLSALVTKSLVRRTAAGRYDLHELVRQYAAGRLRENAQAEAAARARHSRYYLALAAQSRDDLFGARQAQAVAALTAELENVRAAWQWAAQNAPATLRAPARVLYWYYDLRNLARQGAALFEFALANAPGWDAQADCEIAEGHWRALQAMFAYRENRLDDAEQLLAQGLALLEKHPGGAEWIDALWIRAQLAWARGEFGVAAYRLWCALALPETRSLWQTTLCLILLGNVEFEQGSYANSYRTLTESVKVARAQGDPTLLSYAISSLTRHGAQPERVAELEPLARDGYRLAKEAGNRFAVALALEQLAQLVWTKGDAAQAKQLCRESIALCRAQGDDWWLSATLNQLGNFEMASGHPAEAEQAIGEAIRVALRGEFHANVLDALASMASVRAKTGDAACALEIVDAVLRDPASKHRARTRAERLRAELAAHLPPRQAAPAPCETASLDALIARLLVQQHAEIAHHASVSADDKV